MTDDSAPAEVVRLPTADGLVLEGEVVVPDGAAGAVVLAHPHPVHGGSMTSLVTSELFRTLPGHGLAVLRFNFRGVGESGGRHGHGVDEQLDVVAAVDALTARVPRLALITAGWSFGADVSLAVLDPRIRGWFCVAPPLRVLPLEDLGAARDPRPKLLAVPEHDQFRPPGPAAELTEGWVHTTIEVVSGADHFCVGRTDRVAELCVGFVASLTGT
jgi:alpha/beta superfamily hydrolase